MASPSELMRNPVIQTPTESGHATFDIRQRISRASSAPSLRLTQPVIKTPMKKEALAGRLVPLRNWLARDLQGNNQITENLEQLLKHLQDEAGQSGVSGDDIQTREWVQMLALGRQVLRESCTMLSNNLKALIQLSHTLSGSDAAASSEPGIKLDYWVVFSRCWQDRSVNLLLLHLGLLAAVYGNLPSCERLLSFVAPHFKEPWRVHARLMLVLALEDDAAMAQTIFRTRVEPFAPASEAKKLRQALQCLEEIVRFRDLFTQKVFGTEAIRASDTLHKQLG
jgi:hypothetical protein